MTSERKVSEGLLWALLFLQAVLMSGCTASKSGPISYDGTTCQKYVVGYCGVIMWDCENGYKYHCVTNLRSHK